MNYCTKRSELCECASASGCCLITACTKSLSWNNTHSSNTTGNLTTAPKMKDGIYVQLFTVKDGVRYDMKVVNLREVPTMLTNSLMDGIEKLYKV